MTAPRADVPALLFKYPESEAARSMFPPPESAEQALETAVNSIWALGCVAKFLWPVPDRRLSRRLNRVTAPTLIIWGQDDALIPCWYAKEYGRLIAHSRVEIIPDCGHVPQVEKAETTAHLVDEFLADTKQRESAFHRSSIIVD